MIPGRAGIVELFGPPGVGKTTFVTALTARLCEQGLAAGTVVSFRPAEAAQRAGGFASARRIARPIFETFAAGRDGSAGAGGIGTAAELLKLMPPRNLIWSIRLRQYCLRLVRAWGVACLAPRITVFDQAFVQAVCSLVLLGRRPDPDAATIALDAVPRPDVLIRLTAAPGILERRLIARQQGQGRLERLFELDLASNLRSVLIVEELDRRLRACGRVVHMVDSSTPDTLAEGVARVAALFETPKADRLSRSELP